MKFVCKIFVILLFIVIFTCACTYERGIILFNKEPITKENVLQNSKVFVPGKRIYYLFIAPNRMSNEYIRIQVFKMTDNAPWGGQEILRTKDYRLMKDEKYYHTDYFVLHTPGKYVMQVFSLEDLQHPLALCDFYVK